MPPSQISPDLIEQTFLEIRWRTLSLAADLDRLDRAKVTDPRLQKLKEALRILIEEKSPTRAEKIQLLYSDPLTTSN
jgi:hypothetical protein